MKEKKDIVLNVQDLYVKIKPIIVGGGKNGKTDK
jgi:hypothetical protein